jgi:hypothetical protein
VTISCGPNGQVLGAGRKTRSVPPSVRRALEARDRGCRFPGCGLRFTDAHHVKHWADGGETSLRNMALLCKTHHRAVHEGGVRICLDRDGQVVFFTPRAEEWDGWAKCGGANSRAGICLFRTPVGSGAPPIPAGHSPHTPTPRGLPHSPLQFLGQSLISCLPMKRSPDSCPFHQPQDGWPDVMSSCPDLLETGVGS